MEEQHFTTVIQPKTGWFDLKLKEVYAYRDLIFLFVKRNFVSKYKQTILGPAWAIIQPLLTTVVFTLVFGNIAGLAPGGVPVWLPADLSRLLCRDRAGRSPQLVGAYDAADRAAAGAAEPRLRHHHFRADHQVPRSCDAGGFWNAALDVCLADCL